MAPVDPDVTLAELVALARGGEAEAWGELARRFQDVAVGLAVARGCWDAAEDVAQEAFALAFRHLGALEDPQAFPAWFATLVRTAANRRIRRARLVEVPLDGIDPADARGQGHDESVTAGDAAIDIDRVRAVVEALPDGERAVVALHYLGGLSYGEVSAFLAITESAAKKRAWKARSRMKELFPMVTDALNGARPSRNATFSDTVRLFLAIRDIDRDAVGALLAKDPALANATEAWSVADAIASQLGFAGRASALIRAAQTGDTELVRIFLEAGAPVNDPCVCEGAESALWVAVVFGHDAVVDQLLVAGADVHAPAFAGSTPLHAAAQRGHDRLIVRLEQAGADPEKVDDHGRRARDWVAIRGARARRRHPEGWVATGIRAVDLFAPILRGGLVHCPPAVGLGQAVVLFQIADHLAAEAEHWVVGFSFGTYEPAHLLHATRETGVEAQVRLAPIDASPSERRAVFAAALGEVLDRPTVAKLVVCIDAPGHAHDITLALPVLAGAPSVLATFVVSPFTGTYPTVSSVPPSGFVSQLAFSEARARARLWPAIDPFAATTRVWPDERHRRLAGEARALLADYERLDPALGLPDPETLPDLVMAIRGQELVRYLAQPIRVAETATSQPGECTSMNELLGRVEAILGR
jgi:RNA polymerase sigma factor (sigma-70 family)